MKKQLRLTKWFPANVSPVRVGVYEKNFGIASKEYQYWDGEKWHYGTGGPEETAQYIIARYGHNPAKTPRPWRGLAQEPKAVKP